MTGPAEGKIQLNAAVYLGLDGKKVRLRGAVVYIHLKGYALARVTHLDIEHDVLDNLIPPKGGRFLSIRGVEDGIEVRLEGEKQVTYGKSMVKPRSIQVLSPTLNKVLKPRETTRTWVGGKFGGIYIGFKKAEIEKLEEISKTETV